MEFKKGDRVFHKNLKLFGTFIDYAWENPSEETDVDFEMEDGEIEQRHVSVNWLKKKWRFHHHKIKYSITLTVSKLFTDGYFYTNFKRIYSYKQTFLFILRIRKVD